MSNYSEADRQRVLALILYLENGGGQNYDNAPEHVFIEKECPPEYKNKDSKKLLKEYQELLEKIEKDLN